MCLKCLSILKRTRKKKQSKRKLCLNEIAQFVSSRTQKVNEKKYRLQTLYNRIFFTYVAAFPFLVNCRRRRSIRSCGGRNGTLTRRRHHVHRSPPLSLSHSLEIHQMQNRSKGVGSYKGGLLMILTFSS